MMTKARLERFRNKLNSEIACLEEELREMEDTDKGIGNSTILNYQKGYPSPQPVVGFEWDKYQHKQKLLERKRKEWEDVRNWIEQIEDGQVRWVFKMRYIEKMSWQRIARKMGYGGNEDYPRLMIRDKYLKKIGIH
ncbi:MAG: hypothetical protein HFG49_08425 [Lachnospiraceae bacterium]|jgi:RNA polymerase-binding transcription factor DksA|nr:hypothetical protein [Lachnospiraceae bacterium]